jgi:phage shock protein PspC (stress-responsive transcriptional regulator)
MIDDRLTRLLVVLILVVGSMVVGYVVDWRLVQGW